LGHFMSLFCHKKLDLGLCGWGLKIKHKFTGKKMFRCPERARATFECRSLMINERLFCWICT